MLGRVSSRMNNNPLFFFQWNTEVKRELTDKHSYDTASSGRWQPWTKNTSVLLWGRHPAPAPAPAPIPSHSATGCFDLSNHKASGMRCARMEKKKKERKKLGFPPPQLHFFSREQRCLSPPGNNRCQVVLKCLEVWEKIVAAPSAAQNERPLGVTPHIPVFHCAKSWLIVTNEIFFLVMSQPDIPSTPLKLHHWKLFSFQPWI